jgi:DNA-binding FadR family transcriptional regulator
MVDDDLAFHRTIVRASGNDVLAELLATLSSRTLRLRVWRGRTEPGNVEATKREHRAIYQALLDRDPETARVVAAIHIANGEAWLKASTEADARPADPGVEPVAPAVDLAP